MNNADKISVAGNQNIPGYTGKLLRVNLTNKQSKTDILERNFLRKCIGGAVGKGIMPHLDQMLRNYYHQMGWDEKSSKPLPIPYPLWDLISLSKICGNSFSIYRKNVKENQSR